MKKVQFSLTELTPIQRLMNQNLIRVMCPVCGMTWFTNIESQKCLGIRSCKGIVTIKDHAIPDSESKSSS